MKKCPRCNSTYTDDTLSYCLEDGTILIRKYDPEATQMSPFPPPPEPPPVTYERPPAPVPPTPAPHQRSLLAIGVMVAAALAIGLAIGGFIFQRSGSSSSDAPLSSPTPRLASVTTATPTPVSATPTPVSATPTPAPMATPSPSIVQSTPELGPSCVLYNDMANLSVVRVRVNCDTQDCDTDASTIAGEYPDNTPIRVVKGTSVRGARFMWVKVVITGSGRVVWVASSKIKCN